MKLAKVRKNKHPVSIMEMAPVTAPDWHKATCYENLKTQAYNLTSGLVKTADVISFIMDEVSVSTTSAF